MKNIFLILQKKRRRANENKKRPLRPPEYFSQFTDPSGIPIFTYNLASFGRRKNLTYCNDPTPFPPP